MFYLGCDLDLRYVRGYNHGITSEVKAVRKLLNETKNKERECERRKIERREAKKKRRKGQKSERR